MIRLEESFTCQASLSKWAMLWWYAVHFQVTSTVKNVLTHPLRTSFLEWFGLDRFYCIPLSVIHFKDQWFEL